MDKKKLSESDICDKYIRPAMEQAGWHGMDQIYREYTLREGRVVVRGNRAQRDKATVLRANYALFFKANIPLAVVEAKDKQHAVGAGMAQARRCGFDFNFDRFEVRGPAGARFNLLAAAAGSSPESRYLNLMARISCAWDAIGRGCWDPGPRTQQSRPAHIEETGGIRGVSTPPLAKQSRIVTHAATLRADLHQRLAAARSQQALLAEVLVAGNH